MNISAKHNYSYLFQGLGSSTGSTNLNFLSDYMSIKNGSYGKLLKAYYNPGHSKEVAALANDKVTKDTSEDTKKLAEVQSTTDKLKDSADALLATGSQAVFKEDKMTDEDYKAVESFVKDYNSVVSAAGKTDSSSINQRTTNMVYASATNSKLLAKVGITITEDNTLSIDKDSFMKADVSTAKSLFQGNGSYGYRVSAQASMINFAADSEAGKAGTYTASGRYGNNYNTGNLLNLYF